MDKCQYTFFYNNIFNEGYFVTYGSTHLHVQHPILNTWENPIFSMEVMQKMIRYWKWCITKYTLKYVVSINKIIFNASTVVFHFTLTYWFSSMFRPLSRSMHAWVSKSIVSTVIVSVVRTRLLVEEPVADSFWTFLKSTTGMLVSQLLIH